MQAPKAKKKILMLCDHPLSTSGVGVQARFLISGLLKTGEYSFRCLGAAVKHANYDTVVVNDDFIIKPIDGFGDPTLIRLALATEKPDAIFIFTDPRFFIWLWEMEDEIHQICPIVYWHVWDNDPFPAFNSVLYESTDLVNCLSHKTYELVQPNFPDRTNYIPHAIAPNVYFTLPPHIVRENKTKLLGEKNVDNFVAFWINRNARRKMPADVVDAWRIFLDKLEKKHGHRKATLLMHTDPTDVEGPNLYKVVESMNIVENVSFSIDRLDFEKINVLHNVADTVVTISCNEGFGLGTLEAMSIGKPIIALKTGGLTRQVVDWRDGSENGIALDPDCRNMVGSQNVPYIYEDHISNEKVADAFLQMYELGPEKRAALGKKARDYAEFEFQYDKMIDEWHRTMSDTIQNWRNRYIRWSKTSI